MDKIKKREWIDKELRSSLVGLDNLEEFWEEITVILDFAQLQYASLACRVCEEHGKPEIKPAHWVHRYDKGGKALTTPQSCRAANIWAAKLYEEDVENS